MKNVGMLVPTEFPSQIEPGKHCAVFLAGPRLCLELDDYVCERAGPLDVMRYVGAALERFDENHPIVSNIAAVIAGNVITGLPVAVLKKWKTFLIYHRLIMTSGGYGAFGVALKAGGIIFIYIAVHIVLRWTSLILHHRSSREGGVVIVYPPPYYPVLYVPEIWPRGGYSGKTADKVLDAGRSVIGKIRGKAQSAVTQVRGKMQQTPKPNLRLRR